MGKLLERIIQKKLTRHLESRGSICAEQHGFRSGRSTLTALMQANEDILESFNARDQTIALSLDISAAFDSVPHDILLWRLYQMETPGNLLGMIRCFLTNRTASMNIDSESFSCVAELGVPQGSPVSPILFLCFINDIAHCVSGPTKLLIFADDCLVYSKLGRRQELLQSFQDNVDRLLNWGSANLMSFNAQKSHLVRFSRLRKAAPVAVRLRSEILTEEPMFRYLGLTMDAKLNCVSHVQAIKKRCISRLASIRRLSHSNWGASPHATQILVKSCVVPAALYGAEVWNHTGLAVAKKLQAIERIYRLGALMITGCLRTTATQSLFALAGLRPPTYEIPLRLIMLRPSLEALDIRMHHSRFPAKETYSTPLSALHNLVQDINSDIPISTLNKNSLRRTVVSHLEDKESKTWLQGAKGHQLRQTNWCPVISRRRKWIKPLSREEFTSLCRFLSGHFPCKVFLNRIQILKHKEEELGCRFCQETIESRDHLLDCPSLLSLRQQLIGEHSWKWDIILKKPKSRSILAKYCQEILSRLSS